MSRQQDTRFMTLALDLAARGGRDVSPNPMVGAVLVKSGKVVAQGYHRFYGGAHAEVECLSRYRGDLRGSTMYVTLEPCSHYGKTPPCAQLLASTPIARFVVAMVDPNPMVSGAGITALRKAGKRVDVGLLGDEAIELNRRFVRAVTHHRPYVHLKIAQTLDGRITRGGGKREWITGQEARRVVHAMRTDFDAVLVGAGTVRADDPLLTVRGMPGDDPHVVILDGRLSIPRTAAVLRSSRKRMVYVVTTSAALRDRAPQAAALARAGVQVIAVGGARGRCDLKTAMGVLFDEGIGSLLVEGGADVFAQFASAGMIDEMSVFIAPVLAPDGLPAFTPGGFRSIVKDASYMHTHEAGRDIWVHALFD